MSKPIRRCLKCTGTVAESVLSPGDSYFVHSPTCHWRSPNVCRHCAHPHATLARHVECELDLPPWEAQNIVETVLGYLEQEEEER